MPSSWSDIRNFPHHVLATIKPRLGEIVSNVSSRVDVARNKTFCEAQPPWRHNATIWWRHIQNFTSFQNLELGNFERAIENNAGKYLLNFVFLTSGTIKNCIATWYGTTQFHRFAIGAMGLWSLLRNILEPLSSLLCHDWSYIWKLKLVNVSDHG